MEKLKAAIYTLEDLHVIKDLVGRLTKEEIEQEDSDGLDLLQHTILVNYAEAAQYLLLRGFFSGVSNQSKSVTPYLHLCSILGCSTIANILLESRPKDYFAKIKKEVLLEWQNLTSVLERRIAAVEYAEYIEQAKAALLQALNKLKYLDGQEFSALDLAAVTGHTNTTKLLLSSRHSGLTITSLIDSAVKLNSPRALNLILSTEQQKQDVLEEGFKAALKRKEPECLKLLLKHGANMKVTFHGLNSFHVMSMYCSAYSAPEAPSRNYGLDDCTSVLISFGQNVNAKIPFGSYPLYSIIHSLIHEKDQDPSNVPKYHINTLKILLEAGADPNFDEVEYSNKYLNMDDSHMMTIGRELFTSGLNAFFVSLQASDTWRVFMNERLDHCCALLLKHGADPNYLDSYGETPLHDLMKLWAMQHAMGHMHVDLSNMVSMLLQHGLDPNQQSSNGLYAVHYYFKILFNLMGGLIAYERWKTMNKPAKILNLLGFMSTEHAVDASHDILHTCDEAISEGIPEGTLDFIKEHIKGIILKPRSLTMICEFEIWKAVGRKRESVGQLPLPNRFIGNIQNLFILEDT